MYKNIKIRNFRCYEDIEISDFKRINLFVGKNNIGKTSLLEALYLLCARNNPEQVMIINQIRGLLIDIPNLNPSMTPPWDYNFNSSKNKEIVIEAEHSHLGTQKAIIRSFTQPQSIFEKSVKNVNHDAGISGKIYEESNVLEYETLDMDGQKTAHIVIGRAGPHTDYVIETKHPSAYFKSPSKPFHQKEMAGRLEPFLKNGQESLIKILRIIDPNIEHVFITYENELPMINCRLSDGRSIPLVFMGDGVSRLIGLYTEIYHLPGGTYFVDEFENGFHYSVMEKIWRAVGEISEERNVQVFATTHSRECAIAFLNAFKEKTSKDFLLCRLEKVKDKIKSYPYDLEILENTIYMNLEFR